MIVQCTVENVAQLTEYARSKQLVYLRIEKGTNGLLMDYSLLKNITDESEQYRAENVMKDSIRTLFDLITKLNQLSDILVRNIEPISYQLIYDCLANSNIPTFSFSSMLPNGALCLPEEKTSVNVDWKSVFADKLDEEVSELYVKKTSKKYIPVTYRELVAILSK